jgi:hypothetical protein
MPTYSYTNNIVSGAYELNKLTRVDISGNQIFLEDDIRTNFSGSGFLTDYNTTHVHITFDNTLTAEEQNLLSGVVQSNKDFSPSLIKNIHHNWQTLYSDYKAARAAMINEVYQLGFSNLSLENKKIAAQWFTVGITDRSTVYSLAEQIQFGKAFNVNSTLARQKRFGAAVSEAYNNLQKSETNVIISECSSLGYMYAHFGKEGTLEGDGVGLFDYIYARSGTPYYSGEAGLINKPYIPYSTTMSGLVDKMMLIFKSGIYPN